MFVFHVRDMEDERLRRDLRSLSESLALMVGPQQIKLLEADVSAGPTTKRGEQADEEIGRLREEFRAIKARYRGYCRVDIVERRGKELQSLLSSEVDAATGVGETRLEDGLPHDSIPTLAPESGPGMGWLSMPGTRPRRIACASVRGNNKPPILVRIETDGLERSSGYLGWEMLTIGIVAIGLVWILLLWWQLHREARSAEKILASEEKFRGITQAALHPIVVTDDEGRISYWNNAAEETFGYHRQEALDHKLAELLIPERLREESQGSFPLGGGSQDAPSPGKQLEMVAVRKDGREIPIELNASSFRLQNRWQTVGVMIDLSSRKWYEAQLEERARLSQTLAEVGGVLMREESIESIIHGCVSVLSKELHLLARAWVVDQDSQIPRLSASAGPSGCWAQDIEEDVLAQVAARGERYANGPARQAPQLASASTKEAGPAVVGLPLASANALEGILTVFSQCPLSSAVVAALETVADEMTLGIARLRLIARPERCEEGGGVCQSGQE